MLPLGSSISDESSVSNDNAPPPPQACGSCGNLLEAGNDICSQYGAPSLPAPVDDTDAPRGLSEASELADENAAPEAVKFPGYTSYVDSAVASLRATLLAEAEQFSQQQAAADAALHEQLTQLQSELLDEVQDYLLQTVTVNAENGGALRSRCERLRDATLNALATARTKHSQAATTAHATMAEVTCAKFDAELEGHQGRMSKRFLDARDFLGSRLADMRRAKDTELRDKYALDRVLLAEHKAIESHKAQEALAIEKARLAAEWAPLADEHQALKKVVELRDYQVEQAQAEVQRLRTRLKVYEPPWADPTTGKFEVHPDMSWSFLDESMFVTLLEVGVARGNLSKQSLVGALGAASKIVKQESHRRQMAENAHDRGRSRERLPAIAAYYKDGNGNSNSSNGKKGSGQRGGGSRGRSRGNVDDDDYDDENSKNDTGSGRHGDKKKKGGKKGGGGGSSSSKGRSGSRDSGKSPSPAPSLSSRKKAKGGSSGHSKSPSMGGSRKKHGGGGTARSRRMRSDRSLSAEDEYDSGGGDRHRLDSSGSDFGISGSSRGARFQPLSSELSDSVASIGNLSMKAIFAPGFGEGRSGLRPNTNNSTGVTAVKEMNLLKGMVCALRRALDEMEAKVATQDKALNEFRTETVPLLKGQLNVSNNHLKSLTADHASLKEKHKTALAAAAKNEQILKGVVKRNLLLEASLNGDGGARSLSPEKKKVTGTGGGKKSGSKNSKRKKKGTASRGGSPALLNLSSPSTSANQSLDGVSNSGNNHNNHLSTTEPTEKAALVPTEFGFGDTNGPASGKRGGGGEDQQATTSKHNSMPTGLGKGGGGMVMGVDQGTAEAAARAEAEEMVRQRWAAQQQQEQHNHQPAAAAVATRTTPKASTTTGAAGRVDDALDGGEDENGSVYSVAPSLSPRDPNAHEGASRKHKYNSTQANDPRSSRSRQEQGHLPKLSPVIKAQVTPRTPPSSLRLEPGAGTNGEGGIDSPQSPNSTSWQPSATTSDQQQQQREAYFSAANQDYEADLASSDQSTARSSVEEGGGEDGGDDDSARERQQQRLHQQQQQQRAAQQQAAAAAAAAAAAEKEACEARAAASAAAAQLAAFALAAQEKDTLLAQLTSALQQQKRKASSLQQQLRASEERTAKLTATNTASRGGSSGGAAAGRLPPHTPQWALAEDNNDRNGPEEVGSSAAGLGGEAAADEASEFNREFMVSGSAPQRSSTKRSVATSKGRAKSTLPELPPSSGAFAHSSPSGGVGGDGGAGTHAGSVGAAASAAATAGGGAFTTLDTNNRRAPTPSSSSSPEQFAQPPPRLLQSQPLPSQGSPAMTAAYAQAYGFEPNPSDGGSPNNDKEGADAWMDTEAGAPARARAKADASNALALNQQAEARDVLRRSFLLQNNLQNDGPGTKGVPGSSSGSSSIKQNQVKSNGAARTTSPGRVGFAAAAATSSSAHHSAKNPAVPVKQGTTTLQEREDPFSGALASKLRAGGGPSAKVPGGAKRRETWQAAAGAVPPSLPDSSTAGGRGGLKTGGSRGSRLGK